MDAGTGKPGLRRISAVRAFLVYASDITPEDGYHMEKRRFTRIMFEEKCVMEFDDRSADARLLNISLKGATVKFEEDVALRQGEDWRLSFHLGNPDFILQFGVKVVHSCGNFAGVKFVETDLNTMFHLRNLLEARTADSEQVRRELDFLFEDDQVNSVSSVR
jgi:hypothetical protein